MTGTSTGPAALGHASWKSCTLGEVVTLQRGYDLPSHSRLAGTVPIVSSSGISGWHAEARVRGPGVVTGRYGTIGQVFFVGEDFWPLNTTLYVRDFKGNDPLFVSYFLRTLDFDAHQDKGAVPGVNRNHLHMASVQLPPLAEQRAIARILGALDDKIELNRKTNETLEAMARALFKSWFVDFDPVRAKMKGRRPEGMDEETAALFPARLVNAMPEPVPEGWRRCAWGDISKLSYGRALRGYDAQSGRVRVFGTNGPIGWHDEALSEGEGVVIGRKGAYRGIHFTPGPFFVIDTAFFLERRPQAQFEMRWAFYEMLRIDLNGMDSGSAIPSTNREAFEALQVTFPPVEVQRAFVQALAPAWAIQSARDAESLSVTALRDTLLPKLMSGELRVRDPNLAAEAAS